MEQKEIKIAYPPDHLFANKQNRTNPAERKTEEGNACFITKNITYHEGKGIFIDYEGVPYPSKGHVFPEAIYAVCQAKRILINAIKVLGSKEFMIGGILTDKKVLLNKLVDAYLDIVVEHILRPYYFNRENTPRGYYSNAAYEILVFIREFLASMGVERMKADKFGETICLLFQYDNAYYYRLIDIMSETSKEQMMADFPAEFERIFGILMERDPNNVQKEKYKSVYTLVKLVYKIPSVRRAIKAGLNAVDFKGWQMDEADIYHTRLYDGYNIRGLTFEERVKEYVEFHGGQDKLPPRIRYGVQ